MSASQLFSKYDVFAIINNELEDRVKKEIAALTSDQVLMVAENDLCAFVRARLELNVPTILDSAAHYEQEEAQVDARRFPGNRMFLNPTRPYYVPGVRIRIRVPFDGNTDIFHVRPSIWSSGGYPYAEIVGKELVFTYEQEKPDGAQIKQKYQSTLAEIRQYLASLQGAFDGFNQKIQPIIQRQLKQRKETLVAATSIGDSLGLPTRQVDKAAVTYSIALKKRERPVINLPSAVTTGKPEPTLAQADYDYLLRVMKLMSETMEKAPKSFSTMDEEAIRDTFLVHINAQYDGMAGGEVFNFAGKTDILLKVDGRCVFIGECKFWAGEKGFLEAINQLLGYLSWRDTKVAIVVLNRNKNFTSVLQAIRTAVPKHKCFMTDNGVEDETTFRYEFHQANDANRKVVLTVMAFDVPTET